MTEFEKIKGFDIDEMAVFLTTLFFQGLYKTANIDDKMRTKEFLDCVKKYKEEFLMKKVDDNETKID